MPKFGKRSLVVLNELHSDLQLICTESIKIIGFALICGYRNKIDQTVAFTTGKSKTMWPHSKHNKLPSHAFDFIPDKGTKDIDYVYVAGIIMGVAARLLAEGKIHSLLRYGGDFNRNQQVSDDGWDFGHIELD